MSNTDRFGRTAEDLDRLATESEGMASAAYGHGATLMGDSYAETAQGFRAQAAALRAEQATRPGA